LYRLYIRCLCLLKEKKKGREAGKTRRKKRGFSLILGDRKKNLHWNVKKRKKDTEHRRRNEEKGKKGGKRQRKKEEKKRLGSTST
jgi:hypothetical protein